jgi:hypothetical protein
LDRYTLTEAARFNIARGQQAPVEMRDGVHDMRWGLLAPWRGHGGKRGPNIYEAPTHPHAPRLRASSRRTTTMELRAEKSCPATGCPNVDMVNQGDCSMSEFVYLFRASDSAQHEAMGTPERAQRSMQAWLGWMRSLEAGGHLKHPGQPLEPSGRVVRGATRVVTDGPYVEVKDLVLGFIVVEARDLAQAEELAKGCPMLDGDCSVEIRQVRALQLE